MVLYSIGHSNHPINIFLGLLKEHDIRLLADVRSVPYSRYNPQYNKKTLQQVMFGKGIDYLHLGETLGGRPTDPECYVQHVLPTKASDYLHEVDYPAVMKRPWFIQGIKELLEAAGRQTTCILCSEKDPALCHRHHLIGRYLLDQHPEVTIWHILPDSSVVNATVLQAADNQSNAGPQSFRM